MADISANLVKDLRDKTGAGMMECKRALAETGGDIQKAIIWLREKGLAKAQSKSGRTTSEGVIHSYIHSNSKVGVLLELNCETDFVAKTNDFQELAKNLSMQVAAASPRYLRPENVTKDDYEREASIYKKQAAESGKPANVLDKIVEGKMKKFYEDVCLLEQPFIKDQDRRVKEIVNDTIAKLGENITVRRFVRFQLGEEIAEQTK